MRILPIALLFSNQPPGRAASSIVSNGICTHGHPRALIGALMYGYACRIYFQCEASLAYGELVDQLLHDFTDWAALPDVSATWPDWAIGISDDFREAWSSAASEAMDGLGRVSRAVKRGAASIDRRVIEDLGGYGDAGGSGIVSSLCAVYLATRYAQDPMRALLVSAFDKDLDTDTIASMAAGLLAVFHGKQWMGELGNVVQDAGYIEGLSDAYLLAHVTREVPPALSCNVAEFRRLVSSAMIGDTFTLPDRRTASIVASYNVGAKGEKHVGTLIGLRTEDNQGIFVTHLGRKQVRSGEMQTHGNTSLLPPRVAIRFAVRDVAQSAWFYGELLGLPVSRKNEQGILVNGCLAFSRSTTEPEGARDVTICFETHQFEQIVRSVKSNSKTSVNTTQRLGIRMLRVQDPDGYFVEITEHRAAMADTGN